MKRALWIHESVAGFADEVLFEDITEKAENLPANVIMRARGRFHHVGKITSNGTAYQLPIYQRETAKLREQMKNGKIMMLDGHPELREDGTIIPPKPGRDGVGGLVDLEILPDQKFDNVAEAYGTVDISNTTSGKNIAELIRSGVKVPISSRARGTASEVTLTDKHPLAEANPEWVGQKVRIIDENLNMKTFDFVESGASGGSEIDHFIESQKEIPMWEQFKKAMEEDKDFQAKVFEMVQGSELAKTAQETAVNEAVEVATVELKKNQAENVKLAVAEIVKSEGFKTEYADDVEMVACPHCKVENVKHETNKFCAGCGRVIMEAKPVDKDAKDEAIEDLKKLVAEQAESLKTMKDEVTGVTGKLDKTETDKAVSEKLKTLLEGKALPIANYVRAVLAKRTDLTVENIDAEVKESAELIESTLDIVGVKADELPTGVEHGDPEAVEKATKEAELTEGKLDAEKKAQQARVGRT